MTTTSAGPDVLPLWAVAVVGVLSGCSPSAASITISTPVPPASTLRSVSPAHPGTAFQTLASRVSDMRLGRTREPDACIGILLMLVRWRSEGASWQDIPSCRCVAPDGPSRAEELLLPPATGRLQRAMARYRSALRRSTPRVGGNKPRPRWSTFRNGPSPVSRMSGERLEAQWEREKMSRPKVCAWR